MKTVDISIPYNYSFRSDKKVKAGVLNFEQSLWMETIACLAYHPQIQKKIDDIYQNDKLRFTPYFGVNYLGLDPYFYSFPTDIVIFIKKLSAIFQSLPPVENHKFLIGLIKEGYKRYVEFSQEQKGTFSILQFTNSLTKRTERSKVSEGHVNLAVGMVLYYRYHDKLYKVHQDPICEVMLHNMAKDNEIIEIKHNLQSIRSKEIEKEAFQLYEKYIGKKIPRKQLLDDILNEIEYKSVQLHKEEFHKNGIDHNLIYSDGLNRYLKPLTSALYNQGFNEFYIWENLEYTREDYLDFYVQFKSQVRNYRLKEENFEMSFSTHLVLFGLLKQYQKVSNVLFKELQRDDFSAIEAQKQELLKSKQDFLKEKEQIVKETEQLLRKETVYQEEIKRLNKKVKELKCKEQDNEKLKREVVALREYVFTENQLEEIAEGDIEVSSIEKLQQLETKNGFVWGTCSLCTKNERSIPFNSYRISR